MSRRTSSWIVALVALVGACRSGDTRRVDICGRGDRPELAAALAGGAFELEVLDGGGEQVSRGTAPVDGGGTIDLDFAGGRVVRVVGRDAGGAAVASGRADLGDGDACVCLALSPQEAAACGGLACVVEDGTCRFVDAETGDPAGSRTFAIDAAADTTLVAAAPGEAHGDEDTVRAELDRQTALIRFEMDVLPRSAVIEAVSLELGWQPLPDGVPGRPVTIHPVLEPWDEATATWDEREPGAAWTAPGCGDESCDAPIARASIHRAATSYDVPLGLAVSHWVTSPEDNHGLALRSEGNPALLHAREADGGGVRLHVRFHLPDDDLPAPEEGPICGNGLVEADEECDDGDDVDEDACAGCQLARCGDGILRAGVEECDHGGAPDDSCTETCVACADPEAARTWVSPAGRCYALYLPPIARSYTAANVACDDTSHGRLVTFESALEHTNVLAGLEAPDDVDLWIGLSDAGGNEGDFHWETGEPLGTFQPWAETQPSGEAGRDCVLMTGGEYRDAACLTNRGFICERGAWIVSEDARAYRYVLGHPLEWDDAELVCEAAGAHLAVATDQAEADRVSGPSGLLAWIGLSEVDGALAWVTGERLDFDAFAVPDPDLAGDLYCTRLEGEAWDIAGCNRLTRFVCEAD
ncbi:MAG TPA: lectin-like protein [Kofleriaceae bacterium]|nr:lectin-like protein [Kofleriaceae bacterium]